MSRTREEAWKELFREKNILTAIEAHGHAIVTADELKHYYEPRLMASITNEAALPSIFKSYNLGILPVRRGEYVIAPFELFHELIRKDTKRRIPKAATLATLNSECISNEAVAISYAAFSGIYDDFLGESVIASTQSGRMKSGDFVFRVKDNLDSYEEVHVHNAQIEIDGSFETDQSFVLVEAKNVPHDSFLVRQLFYPMKAWEHRVFGKRIRTLFQVYTNGIYNLYEFVFEDPDDYNSIRLLKQENYYLGSITRSDIKGILRTTPSETEPVVPFIQANSLERVISLCELAAERPLTKQDIVEEYEFDPRQSDYYVNAARYLGLMQTCRVLHGETSYLLSRIGREIFNGNLDYTDRYLRIIRQVAKHSLFKEIIGISLKDGIPSIQSTVEIMKKHDLYNVSSESTYIRRASSVLAWVKWILELIE